MKLNELEYKNHAIKALKENFDLNFNVDNLDKTKTKTMLGKVSNLIKEAKQSPDFYKNQTSESYMKLVFMEQALNSHYKELLSKPQARIVIENEEVEKSQVILAAQDMIDSVQKMVEDVNDMMVKELPALVSSIQSEIGVNESSEFNTQVSEALSSLNEALNASKSTLQGALGVITGQGDMGSFDGGDEDIDLDIDSSEGDMDLDVDGEFDDSGDDVDLDLDIDDTDDVGPVGRAKR